MNINIFKRNKKVTQYEVEVKNLYLGPGTTDIYLKI